MTDLFVTEDGDPSGEPLVLVHAGIADHRMWDEVVGALGDHRVIRYDVRGFGQSPDPTDDYFDWQDLVGVLDDRAIERATIVGNSNGGRICADTALEAPHRVARLVLVAAGMPGGGEVNPELEALWQREVEAFEAGDPDAAADAGAEAWVLGVGRARGDVDDEVWARAWTWCREVAAREMEREAAAGEDGAGPQEIAPPIRERLDGISAPTLVLIGQHDQTVMNDNGRRYAEGIPDADLVEVADAAHLISVEQPEVFVGTLRAWLAARPVVG